MYLLLLFPLSLNISHSYNNSNHQVSIKIIFRSQEKVFSKAQLLFGLVRNLPLKIFMLKMRNLLM